MNAENKKIRLLIVDDSATVAQFMQTIFSSQPDFEIVGIAMNGKEAVAKTKKLKPDVITMDVVMPIMDGLEATQTIMENNPTPIVIVSSKANDKDLNIAFEAMAAGALTVIEKPYGGTASDSEIGRKYMVETVRNLSDIKVITRRRKKCTKAIPVDVPKAANSKKSIIALGASTGGPLTLKTILEKLPATFPLPIVIVQHISNGFTAGLTHWLDNQCEINIKLAEHNETLLPGNAYFAPDQHQLHICKKSDKLYCSLKTCSKKQLFCPSVNELFTSLADNCGDCVIAGLLTGMGSDGALGLLSLAQKGSKTFIQDEASCAVYGMPKEALKLQATNTIVKLEEITQFISNEAKR